MSDKLKAQIEQEVLYSWFIKLKDEMPLWKRIVWKLFGRFNYGYKDGYYVEAYKFRNIYLVTKFEVENDQTKR